MLSRPGFVLLGLFACLLLTGCGRVGSRIHEVELEEEYFISCPRAWLSDDLELVLWAKGSLNREAYYVWSPENLELRPVFPNGLPDDGYSYASLTWSPDGRSILTRVSVQVRSGSTPYEGFALLDADGSNPRMMIEPVDRWFGAPTWSPDGQRIAFTESDPEVCGNSLVVINRDGSDKHVILTSACYYSAPSWSPDGEWIAFVWLEDVHVVRPDGTDLTNLTLTPGIDEDWPTWSPDGQQIAFVVKNQERWAIAEDAGWVYVMNRDGSGREQITFDDRMYRMLRWSPDGRWIAAAEELGPIPGVYQSSSVVVLIPVRP